VVEGLITGASISGVGLETVDAGHLARIRSGKALIIIYKNIDKEKEVKVVEKEEESGMEGIPGRTSFTRTMGFADSSPEKPIVTLMPLSQNHLCELKQ